jgi:hypothetical protein
LSRCFEIPAAKCYSSLLYLALACTGFPATLQEAPLSKPYSSYTITRCNAFLSPALDYRCKTLTSEAVGIRVATLLYSSLLNLDLACIGFPAMFNYSPNCSRFVVVPPPGSSPPFIREKLSLSTASHFMGLTLVCAVGKSYFQRKSRSICELKKSGVCQCPVYTFRDQR